MSFLHLKCSTKVVKDGGNSSGLDVRLAFTVLYIYGPYHLGSAAGRGVSRI